MPRPRINPENRAPEFRVIELSDPVAKPGEDDAASLILYAHFAGDEFPDFEVSTEGLVSGPGGEESVDLEEIINDPLANTKVRVAGPLRREASGEIAWGLPDPGIDTGLELRLPGREGIEIDQTRIEAAATILANALRDAIQAGLYD